MRVNKTKNVAIIVATICLLLVQLLTLLCVIDANNRVEMYRQVLTQQEARFRDLASDAYRYKLLQADDSTDQQTRAIRELTDLGYTEVAYLGQRKYTARMGNCMVQAFYYDGDGAIPSAYNGQLVVDLGLSNGSSDLLMGAKRNVGWINANSDIYDYLLGELSPCFDR